MNGAYVRTMSKNIVVILGHPAKKRITFCEALANAYVTGARNAGHEVHLIKLSDMRFDPILHEGFHGVQDPESEIQQAQNLMLMASHWVIIYPLWQLMVPALLKGFLERALTQKFASDVSDNQASAKDQMEGKTARIIQTMGMPNIIYRLYFKEHGAKALKSTLQFIGVKPVGITYCGQAENPNDGRRQNYIKKARYLGSIGN